MEQGEGDTAGVFSEERESCTCEDVWRVVVLWRGLNALMKVTIL